MFVKVAALDKGVVGIALKNELRCVYEIVLGPGPSRVYQCR